MNQIIVILILFKNYILNFKITIAKIVLCIIALLLSLYIYEIYNDTKIQKIYVKEKCIGADVNSRKILSISLDYASTDNESYKATWFSDSLSGTTIHYRELISLDSVDNYSSKVTKNEVLSNILTNSEIKNKIDKTFISSDYLRYFYVITEYDENNWFFPHMHMRGLRNKPLFSNTSDFSIQENHLKICHTSELPSNISLPGTDNFLRRKIYYLFESIFADKEDSICAYFQDINLPESPYKPQFYSA